MNKWDYVLDTNVMGDPKMATAAIVDAGLKKASKSPFRVVPFFDPGPWGGQWMKEICDLDRETPNFAWCFDCVPEENSLYLGFGEVRFEIPSIDLVFSYPRELLGNPVYGRFGDEFPIRFDFLDTMDGGNLSLQVHPLTQYIQEKCRRRCFGLFGSEGRYRTGGDDKCLDRSTTYRAFRCRKVCWELSSEKARPCTYTCGYCSLFGA